jgi:hypothetical protein
MTSEEKILTSILQNAQMGTSSIRQIIPHVSDPLLKSELRHQLREYERRHNEICRHTSNLHLKAKSISPAAKAMGHISIACSLAMDNSSGHIAEMLIRGTDMGIIDINKALNSSSDSPEKLTNRARELLVKEQHYIDRLKPFL